MIDPAVVVFAIQAGVRLGTRINKVLIDKTHERALVLPLGDLFGEVTANAAFLYFHEQHPELIAEGGPYRGFSKKELRKAYQTVKALNDRLGDPHEMSGEAAEILQGLQRFEQTKNKTRPAVQQILGTVVEIGIDYFAANPALLQGDSGAKRILQSFVIHLDEVKFADDTPPELVGNMLLASLKALDQNVSLIDDDQRLQALVGGITGSLIEDYESLTSNAAKDRRDRLVKRIASSIIRGGAAAFSDNIDLFIEGESTPKELVSKTLSHVVAGIDGKENLFTNESLELIFESSLSAVSENADLFTSNDLLRDLIKNTVTALTRSPARSIFSNETAGAVLQGGLEAVRDNLETLITPDAPQTVILADTITAIANGLSTKLAGGGNVRDLLSKRQLVELTQIIFLEVAENPERLLAKVDGNERRTALAQVIGSLAKALGDDPKKLVTGEGFLELAQTAIHTAVLNADKLLDLDTTNVRTNVLYQIVQQSAEAVLAHPDPRGMVSRGVFLEIVERSMPVVSANLDGLLEDISDPVKATIGVALDLASDSFANRINGDLLPILVQELLKQVLRGQLNLEEEMAVTAFVDEVLQAA